MRNHKRLPARVNITLDVANGAVQQKKELPMRLLFLGDFSHKPSRDVLTKRERITVNTSNLDNVIAHYQPQLLLTLPNKSVPLTFNCLEDFQPYRLIQQVDSLKRLTAMRQLLKELKANLIDNQVFKRKLSAILNDKDIVDECQQELEALK